VLGALSPEGHLLHPEFTEAVTRVEGQRLLHVAGLGLFLAGALLGAWNLLRTWSARPAAYPSTPVTEPPLEPMVAAEEAPARKRVEDEMERLSAAMHSAGISTGSRPPAPPSSAAAESKKAGGKAERDRLYAVAQLQTAFLKQQNPVSDDEDEEEDRTM